MEKFYRQLKVRISVFKSVKSLSVNLDEIVKREQCVSILQKSVAPPGVIQTNYLLIPELS